MKAVRVGFNAGGMDKVRGVRDARHEGIVRCLTGTMYLNDSLLARHFEHLTSPLGSVGKSQCDNFSISRELYEKSRSGGEQVGKRASETF